MIHHARKTIFLTFVFYFPITNVSAQSQRAVTDDLQLDLSIGKMSDYTRSNWWQTTRNYRTKYHPWTPPGSLKEWEAEAAKLKTQLLVSQSLLPMPEKTPLNPVIHGKIDCGDYTIEKVFFASRPGLYVTGNLYRPVGVEGKRPGLLCPHGHWKDGRFYDAGEEEATRQLKSKAETFPVAARYPLQARMVHLARMGCVVFHYDMISYADSQGVDHRNDFSTAADGLWLLESMGLQTWNSIRSLDFLCSLEDVDEKKIAVTGASGGGTQTFILGAIDDRVAVAVPAVMVSTGMQGGCICENSPYLRVDTNNIALAALFAPKPLGLTGADDWTVRLMSRGYPELKNIYSFYDKADSFKAWVHPEFGHNYNSVSRHHMYLFLQKHLQMGNVPLEERDFVAKTASQLSVFDEEHPRPADSVNAKTLRADWVKQSKATIENLLLPENKKQYNKIVGSASGVLLGGTAPAIQELNLSTAMAVAQENGSTKQIHLIARKDDATVVPMTIITPSYPTNKVVCWFDTLGSNCLEEESRTAMIDELFKKGTTIVTADLRGFGINRPADSKPLPQVDARYYGYTFGYNRPLISQQVQDIAAVVVTVNARIKNSHIRLLGTGKASPAVLLAQTLLSEIVEETEVDLNGVGLGDIDDIQDPLYLPGALKYGGFGGLAGITPCKKITIHGVSKPLQKELAPLKSHVQALELHVRPGIKKE